MLQIKKDSGFSLIEALVTLAVLMVVIFLLTEIYVGQSSFFQREEARLDTSLALTQTLTDITAQVRQAVRVAATSTFDSISYASGLEQLILALPSVDSQGQLLIGYFDYVVYYRDVQNPTKLMKKVAPSASSTRPAQTKCLADNVSGLTFIYNNQDFDQVNQVQASLLVLKMVGGHNFTASSTVKVLLRNK